MSSKDSTSDDDDDATDDDAPQQDHDIVSLDTDATDGDSDDRRDGEDENEGSGYTPFHDPMADTYQDLHNTLRDTHQAMLKNVDLQQFRQTVIEAGAINKIDLTTQLVAPKKLSQPLIDPETIEAIRKASATLQQFSEVHRTYPDSEIVELLQQLDDPDVVEAYERAASLEQIEQHPVKEQGDTGSDTVPHPGDDHGMQEPDEPEPELAAEPREDPVDGSTFLQYTATALLSYSEQLPEDAARYLEKISDAEKVEKQKEYFRKAVPALDEKDVERLRLVLWQWVGIIMTFHYGSNVVDSSRDEDTSADVEDGEEQ